jgi:hypothetical protein
MLGKLSKADLQPQLVTVSHFLLSLPPPPSPAPRVPMVSQMGGRAERVVQRKGEACLHVMG